MFLPHFKGLSEGCTLSLVHSDMVFLPFFELVFVNHYKEIGSVRTAVCRFLVLLQSFSFSVEIHEKYDGFN